MENYFIPIITELLPQGVTPRYEYDGDVPLHYIDRFDFINTFSFLPIKGDFQITLPLFGMTNSDTAIIENIKRVAAKLAYTSGYAGYIFIAIKTISFSFNTLSSQNVIEMSMCYVPGEYGREALPVLNIPDQVDLCEFFPDADIGRMKNLLILNEIVSS